MTFVTFYRYAISYNKHVNKQKFRPDMTEYQEIARELLDKLNSESWSNLSKTDVVKIALERFYKDAFPEKHLKRMKRKYFSLMQF